MTERCPFEVGQKVICIDSLWFRNETAEIDITLNDPRLDDICTIRQILPWWCVYKRKTVIALEFFEFRGAVYEHTAFRSLDPVRDVARMVTGEA